MVKKLITETIMTSGNWAAPIGVGMLPSLVGRGGSGTPYEPARDAVPGPMTKFKLIQNRYRRIDGGPDDVEVYITRGDNAWPGTTPPDATVEVAPFFDGTHDQITQLIAYGSEPYPEILIPAMPEEPETTGPDTTGFGRSFAGGVGGIATPATFNDVIVTPGQSYALVVPTGGYITITYWK
jgi:hypothetical protein